MSMVIYQVCLELNLGIYPKKMVPLAGIELATFSLRMNCSTN